MGVPLIQKLGMVQYMAARKLRGERRFPLVLMLEPLFRCNLACIGCGKIQYPKEILAQSLTPEACFEAAEQCGAPVVAVAGGEPFLHEEMPRIVSGLIERKRFVYFCTNGLLLRKKLSDYAPSPYLTFSLHLDGGRESHDRITNRPGLFDSVLELMHFLRGRGFRFTVNCTLYNDSRPEEIGTLFDRVMALGAQGITISPAFSYQENSRKGLFPARSRSKALFRAIFERGRGRGWKFNHSSLFLDFLSGNRTYTCTPWGNVTRNILGWQRPCYLLAEGYAPSYRALMEKTNWADYGPGRNPKCRNCMLHSGFEATAVNDAIAHPLTALGVFLKGPCTEGPFAPDPTESGVLRLLLRGETNESNG